MNRRTICSGLMTIAVLARAATFGGGVDAADGACAHGKVVNEMFA